MKEFNFERAVLLELDREHFWIRQRRKIKMEAVAIVLFDSESMWGQFDPMTRTISISRRLVNEFSWSQVLGVFKHEIAHQYASELDPLRFRSETAHGPLFKEACQRLGVPEQFCKAGLDLQTSNLDWRQDLQDEGADRILDRVKKLLALASSTNEHEALAAMEKVRELYAKYNLEQAREPSRENFVHSIITRGKKRIESWEQRTISLLVEHFFVQVITYSIYEARSGERVRAIEIIGTRENVLMAEYVYHFLLQQAEYLVESAVASGEALGRSEKRSFRLGVLDGFSIKLKNAERKSAGTADGSNSGSRSAHGTGGLTVVGQALAEFRRDTRLEDYLRQIYPNLGTGRSTSGTIDYDAFSAGHAAGKTIHLSKPVTSRVSNQGRLLS